MRIAITALRLDPHHGGAGAWTFAFARWLLDRGQDIHLVGCRAGSNLDFPLDRVVCLPARHNRLQVAEEFKSWLDARSFDLVHDMGVGVEFDIFHSHFGSYAAMEQAREKSWNRIDRLIRKMVYPLSRRKQSIKRLISQQFSNQDACFVGVSKMVSEDLVQLEGIRPHQVRCIPNGVDVERYHPDTCREIREYARNKFSIDPDTIVLSVVAHNFRLKGIPQLVEAIGTIRDFPCKLHLLVIGGHRQKRQESSVGKHRVTYTGAIDFTEVVYAASDAYIHPTFYDACCLAVLEAMACGLPVITTMTNGACERIVHGRSGFIMTDTYDHQGLMESLLKLTDPVLRHQVGNEARIEALRWTQTDNFLAMEQLYEDIIAAKTDHIAVNSRMAA